MKTAVVTGAAQGVGLATSKLLAQQGYHVVMTDVQPLGTQEAALTAQGLAVSSMSGDVSSEAFTADLAAHLLAQHGGADVLVNNAGISLICPAEETSLDQTRILFAQVRRAFGGRQKRNVASRDRLGRHPVYPESRGSTPFDRRTRSPSGLVHEANDVV